MIVRLAAPERLFADCGEVVFLGGIPVYDIPKRGDIVGAAVLVEEVVRVLPDVDHEDAAAFDASNGFAHQRAVLVGRRRDRELFIRGDKKPGPAGTKAGRRGFVKFLLQLCEAAKGRVDSLRKFSMRRRAVGWCENAPEEDVVAVSAGIIAHAGADRLWNLAEIGDEGVHRLGGQRGMVLQDRVGIIDVGLVVLAVVDLHRARIKVRLEGIVGIGEWCEFVGHNED